jgi:tetratricopeptide (TPR) repeat protein
MIISSPERVDENIDRWLAENNFSKIERTFDAINIDRAEYQQLLARKNEIEAQKTEYIQDTIKQAAQLQQKQQWQQAVSLYETALTNTDHAAELETHYNQLLKLREQEIISLREQLLFKDAKTLISYKPIYERLEQLLPADYRAQNDLKRYKNYVSATTRQLDNCAEDAIKKRQYDLAKECYLLSHTLVPGSHKQDGIERLDSMIKNVSNQKFYSKLFAAYRNEYQNKNYHMARKNLQTILKLNPQHEQARKLLDSLTQEINRLVNNKLSLGRDLYSQQKIDEALAQWKQAREMDPDNAEVEQLILRAEKVQKKIESLENNQ